ncbi:LuxR C-terminal-related transcriptional regulator [Cupriavidus sp. CV2]|uniref:helix-turn-helix transcriptional regulator n=1 Tax=Cupriavidus ulmosensis TaxID=3065913 RepID=UPI00296AF470|nr:LuxR C-terminal-related transcriptional regulator [Cupriavidus sp. CV2]MDW3687940.1 LuxR C-terminal-related transcriptional regulator [Cupriavidus sp. CV2]
MNALLIEDNPLLRLGLLRMLGGVECLGHVICLDPADFALLQGQMNDFALVILGLPQTQDRARALLETARTVLSAQYLLLLVDGTLPPVLSPDLAWGICTWLPKASSLAAIEAAIRLVLADDTHWHGAPVPHPCAPLQALAAQGGRIDLLRDEARMLKLTPRQYEVLVLLSHGYPLKTVSQLLNISVATVKSHVALLYQRLQVSNKSEAIHAARQRGARFQAGISHGSNDRGAVRAWP